MPIRARLWLICAILALPALAQSGRNLWSPPLQTADQAARQVPWGDAQGAVYALDEAGMAALLQAAPLEFSRDAAQDPFHMLLPLPDGGFAEFAIVEASVMHPDLATKYPGIRTFRGNGIDVPAATARLDITPQGFHAQILSPGGAVYIDPQVRSRETYVGAIFTAMPRRKIISACWRMHSRGPCRSKTTLSAQSVTPCAPIVWQSRLKASTPLFMAVHRKQWQPLSPASIA